MASRTVQGKVKPSDLFECAKCGDCCIGYGGTVITESQAAAIARFVGMDVDRFLQEKCRFSGGKPVLSQREDGHCIFWDKLCTIYPVRPDMCRRWPFIEGVLRDTRNWDIMSRSCPGMRTPVSEKELRNCIEAMLAKSVT